MYSNEIENMRDKHGAEIHDFLTRMSDLDTENKRMHMAFSELKLKNDLCFQEQELLRQDKACSVVLQEYKYDCLLPPIVISEDKMVTFLHRNLLDSIFDLGTVWKSASKHRRPSLWN